MSEESTQTPAPADEPATPTGSPGSERLRVLTANLWSGGADPAALARQLGDLAVDVCAVQELAPAQARAIASVLPHGKLEPAEDHTGIGIALGRPAEVEALALPERSARRVHLQPESWPQLDAPIELVNVHVVAPHSLPPWRSLRVRRGQVDALLAFLHGSERRARAVVGDFNATPIWPVYRRVAGRLRDAAREHATRHGRRPARTWGPTAWAPRLLRIDHAFVEGVEVEHVDVVQVAGSDHSALLVDLVPTTGSR